MMHKTRLDIVYSSKAQHLGSPPSVLSVLVQYCPAYLDRERVYHYHLAGKLCPPIAELAEETVTKVSLKLGQFYTDMCARALCQW
jgi:hypothetical protein